MKTALISVAVTLAGCGVLLVAGAYTVLPVVRMVSLLLTGQ